MSGPKGGHYEVVSAEELERRALVTAHQRHSRLRADFLALCDTLSGYGESVARPTDSPTGDSNAVNAASATLEAEIVRLQALLSDHRVKAALAAIPKVKITLNVAPSPGTPSSSDSRDQSTRTSTRKARTATSADYIAQAEAIVAKAILSTQAEIPAPILTKLTSMQGSAQASTDSLRMALDDLSLSVQRHRDELKQQQVNAKLREQILATLDGCEGAEAALLRRSVERITPGSAVPSSVIDAQQVAAADAAATDATFVQTAVVDALSELGYEVDEAMDVVVAQGGVLLEIPGHKQHAARIRAKDGQLRFNVVRTQDVNSEQDDVHA